MKKFKFRFEALAKVRKIELQEQAKIVAVIANQMIESQSKVEEIRNLVRLELDRVHAAVEKEAFDEQLLRESRSYQLNLEIQIQSLNKKIQELSQRHLKERSLLIERQRKKATFDKLEEKDYEKFLDGYKKIEEQEIDEAGSNSWNLRHRLGHNI